MLKICYELSRVGRGAGVTSEVDLLLYFPIVGLLKPAVQLIKNLARHRLVPRIEKDK